MKRKHTQSGSQLIEAIISLLIFSIGLIALVNLAGKAMNQAGQSRSRNEASYLAGELIGEMWVSTAAPASFDTSAWNTRVQSVIPGSSTTVTFSNATASPPAAT
ncbi:MAG TPA: hypothetical protein VI279_01260, partial [Rhodocyclaceae bacterium]